MPLSVWFMVFGFSRNVWRIVAALGGIILAIALITAANTAFDRATGTILWAALDNAPIDLILWEASAKKGTVEDAASIAGTIGSIDEVVEAHVIGIVSHGVRFTLKGSDSTTGIYGVIGLTEGTTDLARKIGIELGSPVTEL